MDVALDGGAQRADALDRRLEVRDLEPDQDSVSERDVRRRERAVMVHDVEAVDLQHDLAVLDDLLVLVAAVPILGVEEPGVEAAGCRDVADDDQRLRPDRRAHEPQGTTCRRLTRPEA
jgi:hypothetical protein